MPVQYENQTPINAFSGIQVTSNPESLPEDALQYCHNFVIGMNGELIKRPMRVAIGNTMVAGTVDPYFVGQALGIGSNDVFVSAGTKTYKCNSDFNAFAEVTTFAGKTVYDAVQYMNKMYFSVSDGVYEWTVGTTAVGPAASSPAGGLSLILFQNRLFTIAGSRVYWTGPGVPDWTGAAGGGYSDVAPGDGDNLTAMVAIGDRILLFKQTSMYVLYTSENPADWVVRGVSPEVGCSGPRAVINVRGLIYFLALDGFWITDGVALSRVSDPILPAFSGLGRYREAAYYDSLSVYKDFIIIKANVTSRWDSANYGTFFYRFSGNAKGFTTASELFIGTTINSTRPGWAQAWLIRDYAANASPRYVVPGTNSFFRIVDTVYDQAYFSETVTCYFRTKALTFDQPTRYKRVKYANITLYAEPMPVPGSQAYGGLKYYYVVDGMQSDIEQIWHEGITGTRNYKLRGAGYGRSVSLYFVETSSVANLQVLGVNFIHMLARQQDRSNV